MELFRLETHMTLKQVIQLRALTGATNGMTSVFKFCDEILHTKGIRPVTLSNHIHVNTFHIGAFQEECDARIKQYERPTLTVKGKKVYQDDYELAIARLTEVK
jgi:hypothetical protein